MTYGLGIRCSILLSYGASPTPADRLRFIYSRLGGLAPYGRLARSTPEAFQNLVQNSQLNTRLRLSRTRAKKPRVHSPRRDGDAIHLRASTLDGRPIQGCGKYANGACQGNRLS